MFSVKNTVDYFIIIIIIKKKKKKRYLPEPFDFILFLINISKKFWERCNFRSCRSDLFSLSRPSILVPVQSSGDFGSRFRHRCLPPCHGDRSLPSLAIPRDRRFQVTGVSVCLMFLRLFSCVYLRQDQRSLFSPLNFTKSCIKIRFFGVLLYSPDR